MWHQPGRFSLRWNLPIRFESLATVETDLAVSPSTVCMSDGFSAIIWVIWRWFSAIIWVIWRWFSDRLRVLVRSTFTVTYRVHRLTWAWRTTWTHKPKLTSRIRDRDQHYCKIYFLFCVRTAELFSPFLHSSCGCPEMMCRRMGGR